MQNIQRFSSNTKKALKSYVYGLRYPSSEKQYFYIGKGTGNRVFSHINQKIKRGVKDPKYDVIQSLQNLGGPKVDIIRHGLSEKEAFLLEATLIDVFGVEQLTNKVKGIDTAAFGVMSLSDVESNYKGKEFNLDISAVCFKISQTWSRDMNEEQLYDKIRGNWALSIKRAEKVDYGIGVFDGVIRGVYKICNWEQGRPTKRGYRYKFNGYKEEKLQKYVGYNLHNHPGHAVSGPLFYYNG